VVPVDHRVAINRMVDVNGPVNALMVVQECCAWGSGVQG